MTLKLPEADTTIIQDKKNIVQDLFKITKNIIHSDEEIKPYETDGLSVYRQKPIAVVLPETTEQVSKILKYCHNKKIKVVPRGAGTGLSGGSIPLADCILMGMGKFNKILETDFDNRCVVAQPCVANLAITQAVQHRDFYYAPDPS
ncbi:MAG: FAD-binding protein, partial [alpha proteobacterium HIMB114]